MTAHRGDVDSRAFVRWLELQRSAGFVTQQLRTLLRATPATRLMPAAQDEPHALRSGATLAPIIDEAERRERVAWTSI
jgi:hypothetical protein